MPYVIAALILLGVITLLNLVLTMAVIRRLRERETDIAAHSVGAIDVDAGIPVGETVPSFHTTATDGSAVTGEEAADKRMLYAFFSVDCKACWPKVPAFVTYARRLGLGADQVVSAVVGTGAAAEDSVAKLESVGRVVMEPTGGPLSSALEARGFPSFVLVGAGGAVEAYTFSLTDMPQSVSP
jgi:hypothetical protein